MREDNKKLCDKYPFLTWHGDPLYIGYDEIEEWEAKYDRLSEKTCINCGKPAKYMSIGWISPWCEDCAKEINDTVVKIEDVEDFFNTSPEERKKFIVKF